MRLMPKSPLVLTAAALLLTACGDSTEPRIPAALELEHEAVEVEVNDSTLVNVVVLDQFGREFVAPPSGFQIDWHVQDPAVARVTDGYIVGLRTGSTTVAASAAGITPVEVGVDVVPTQFTGQLSFDYAGHASGSFEVSSDFSLDPERGPTTGEWVVAFHDPDFGSHDVLAVRTREDGSVDLAWFWVTGEVTAAGTHDVDSGVLVLGFVEALNAAEGSYEVVGGSVDFTAVSSARMAGSFVLTLRDAAGNVLEATNGVFDAPVVPASSILASSAPGVDAAVPVPAAAASLLRSLAPARMP
jgi:hypothetical protein